LTALYPDSTFAFRHGWECYKQNMDPYGNYTYYPDSIETAVNELIDIEKVDAIIALRGPAAFSNSVEYGHEWYDDNGSAISALPGKTFKQCVEDIHDGVGPATKKDLNAYLLSKPWAKHDLHLQPLIKKMAGEHKPAVQVIFAKPYGDYDEFGMSLVEMLKYTVEKYSIPQTASVKYILVHHGFYGFYNAAQDCDCYFQTQVKAYSRAKAVIEKNFSWASKFEIANGGAEFAERAADGDSTVDPPGIDKPFGNVLSQGEQIDMSINGRYVNELGQLIDNGDDNFEYVIVCPYYFDTASTDTLYEKRWPLGNNIPAGKYYERDEADEDGTEYNQDDIDDEDFTIKVYDGTGWPSTPLFGLEPVYKGSRTKPTTVIVTGEVLALGNGPARTYFTDATLKAASEAIKRYKK
ncbi:MAG: hypothetical protein WCQ99_10175, partial [Pseudomonadota bacterium]